jgi:hypothetical protein
MPKGNSRKVDDFMLIECYLIAQNGDPINYENGNIYFLLFFFI